MKKYDSLRKELLELVRQLKEYPDLSTPIGASCYKIRLAIASKGKGKSGGARVVINLVLAENDIYLRAIYDKSEKDNLSPKELHELLKSIPL